jgi:hypothetical protein
MALDDGETWLCGHAARGTGCWCEDCPMTSDGPHGVSRYAGIWQPSLFWLELASVSPQVARVQHSQTINDADQVALQLRSLRRIRGSCRGRCRECRAQLRRGRRRVSSGRPVEDAGAEHLTRCAATTPVFPANALFRSCKARRLTQKRPCHDRPNCVILTGRAPRVDGTRLRVFARAPRDANPIRPTAYF